MTTSDELGVSARQVMIDIFRNKDVEAVDRNFGRSFVQRDPSLPDGFAGMRSYAAEIASSPAADITIYRTLVDGDSVLLNSRYEGLKNAPGRTIAMDLFRFADGKIVEHWGGQEPEGPIATFPAIRRWTVRQRCRTAIGRKPTEPSSRPTGKS